jgi:hypothetical protein
MNSRLDSYDGEALYRKTSTPGPIVARLKHCGTNPSPQNGRPDQQSDLPTP